MISHFECVSGWDALVMACQATSGKMITPPISDSWKKRMLLSEHSPIRLLVFSWTWESLPYFSSVHFVRHKIGIEHFVKSQREDRTGVPRNTIAQDAPVTHHCVANMQAIINISKVRLCATASKETRGAWQEVVDNITALDGVLGSVCVPMCVYSGFCRQFKPCGKSGNMIVREANQYRNTEEVR
jgi:hypothetical protein